MTRNQDDILEGMSVRLTHVYYYAPPDYTFWLGEAGEVGMPCEFTGFLVGYPDTGEVFCVE